MDPVAVKVEDNEGDSDNHDDSFCGHCGQPEDSFNDIPPEIYIETEDADDIKQEYLSAIEDETVDNDIHADENTEASEESQSPAVTKRKGRPRKRIANRKCKSKANRNVDDLDENVEDLEENGRRSKSKKLSPRKKTNKEVLEEMDIDNEVTHEQADKQVGTGRRKKRSPRKVAKKDMKDLYDESKVKLDGSYAHDSDTEDFICEICGKDFVGKEERDDHSRKCGLKKPESICKICNKVLITKSEKKNHHKVHKRGTFLCDKCGKAFAMKESLVVHWKTMHTNISYPCGTEGCSKKFSNSANRIKHINNVHLNLRKYPCPHCDMALKTTSALKMHIFTKHTDDDRKPEFKCTICQKVFHTNSHRNLHELTHSNKKPFQCSHENCGKLFRDKSNLTKHKRVHDNYKPYRCDKCDESFSRKIYLETHQYKHTGKKMFECTECKKSFSQKGNLKSHMSLHGVERTVYGCLKCNRNFNHKSNYTKHMLNHDKPDYKNEKTVKAFHREKIVKGFKEKTQNPTSNVIYQYDLSEEESDYEDLDLTVNKFLTQPRHKTQSTVFVCNTDNSKKQVVIIKHKIIPKAVQSAANDKVKTDENEDDESQEVTINVTVKEEATQVEAVESIDEIQDTVEASTVATSEAEKSEERAVQSFDMETVQLIPDGVSELIENMVTSNNQLEEETETEVGMPETAVSLVDIGVPETSVVDVGVSTTAEVNVGVTQAAVLDAGVSVTDIVNVGVPETAVLDAGVSVANIVNVGVTETTVVAVGEPEIAVVEDRPVEPQTVKVFVAGDNTAHEIEADVLKDFLEKCNKNVNEVGMIPLISEPVEGAEQFQYIVAGAEATDIQND